MASTVEANWTAHHPRRMAQKETMFVRGVLSGPTAQANDSRYPVPIPTSSTPAADRSTIACGTCFCGAVQIELPLDSEPAISVVCHCTDCREWHSVGSVPYMMFPLLNLGEHGGEMPIKVCMRLPSVQREASCVDQSLSPLSFSPFILASMAPQFTPPRSPQARPCSHMFTARPRCAATSRLAAGRGCSTACGTKRLA